MRLRDRPWLTQCGVAVAFTAAAVFVHWLLASWLNGTQALIVLAGAVLASVWVAGIGAGILSAVLGILADAYLLLGTDEFLGFMSTHPLTVLGTYAVCCAALIAVGAAARNRKMRAERYAARLEAQTERLQRESEERRAAELAAQEAHRRVQLVLSGITDGFYALDREWRFTEFNPQAERFFGVRREDVLGKSIWELFPPARPHLEHHYLQALRENAHVVFECTAPTPAGKWAETHVYPMDGGLWVFFRDITDRKRAEQALRESEERLRLGAEIGGFGIYEWNAATDTHTWSPETYRIYGVEPGTPVTWDTLIGRTHPADRGLTGDHKARILDPSMPEINTLEQRIVRPDGEVRWVYGRTRRIYEGTGSGRRVVRIMGAVQDVTDLKRAEEALKEADRRKDEFLATLAHELRNPLAPIASAVHYLQLKGAADPDVRNAYAIIERQTRHLARLVDDLMDVSRISRGRIQLQREQVNMADVVAHAVEASRSLIENARHTLELSVPDTPLYVEGDPVRLTQIVGNLLNNAAKYTPPGGRIELHVESTEHEVYVRVRDTGIGMSKETLGRIFEMFTQADGSSERARGGLGIGLALSQRLARLHGGFIEAYSEGEGRGSTFTFRLPRQEADTIEPTVPAAPTRAATTSRRVLAADDNVDAAESLAALLQAFGHIVQTAHDGVEAVQAAQRFHPEVAFLDIGMPRLDGYEVARRIRALPGGESVRLIALTGWGQEEDRQRARDAGFDHHLTKPVDPAALQRLLEGAAGEATAGRV